MPTTSHFDLAVIGGGPAGTSAAITAACSGASVALFEAKAFPRHRVCGEFVSAEALEVLTGLLVKQSEIHSLLSSAPVISRTRIYLGGRTLEAPVSPPALSIPRFHLDAALWKAAQSAGAICHALSEVSTVVGDGPFLLRTAVGEFSARAVIIAAGRWSQFVADRTLPPGPKWIGLKAHFLEVDPSLTTDLYFFEHGYCGVQPISGDVVNACAMVRSDRATTLTEVLELHPALRDRAAHWRQVIPTVSTAPLVYRPPQAVRGNLAFVGDAASFIDPFVGDGISIALRSGKTAAQCLCRFLTGERAIEQAVRAYNDEYSRQFVPLLAVASRVRWGLSLPGFVRATAFELLRLPGVMPLIIRKTRQAA